MVLSCGVVGVFGGAGCGGGLGVYPGEGVLVWLGAWLLGGLWGVVCEVGEAVVDFFWVCLEGGGDGFCGAVAVFGEGVTHAGEDLEEVAGGFFACFDAGLVVGVDVDEAGVEGDGAFVEGDEEADVEGGGFFDAEGDGLAVVFVEGFAGAAEEALEVVAGGGVWVDFDLCGIGGFADFDEGGEEVVDAVAELLDVGVLVGGAFVAVDGDALVDGVAVEVVLFADGLHDELLEVFAEEHEAVFVGEDDHVFGAFAVACVVPHEGEEHGGVLVGGEGAGFFVHGGGSGEEVVDVDALEGHGDEADGAHDGGASAYPVGHGEDFEPVIFCGVGFEFAVDAVVFGAGDGDGVFGEVEVCLLVGVACFEHAVACFWGAAGFGDDDGEGVGECGADVGEGALDAVWVGVVEEVGL